MANVRNDVDTIQPFVIGVGFVYKVWLFRNAQPAFDILRDRLLFVRQVQSIVMLSLQCPKIISCFGLCLAIDNPTFPFSIDVAKIHTSDPSPIAFALVDTPLSVPSPTLL